MGNLTKADLETILTALLIIRNDIDGYRERAAVNGMDRSIAHYERLLADNLRVTDKVLALYDDCEEGEQ